ncbi:MAG: hypothetical protein ACE5KE_06510 [Methanosarcinales archaeon]
MSILVKIDSLGKITLPKRAIEVLGIKKYIKVDIKSDKVVLKPTDLLEELSGTLSSDKPFLELKKELEDLAVKELKKE